MIFNTDTWINPYIKRTRCFLTNAQDAFVYIQNVTPQEDLEIDRIAIKHHAPFFPDASLPTMPSTLP